MLIVIHYTNSNTLTEGNENVYAKRVKKAAAHIRRLAREKGIAEEDMRAEMKAAMDAGRNNPDPDVQARWADFRYSGPEPTVDEFVLWVASLVKERR